MITFSSSSRYRLPIVALPVLLVLIASFTTAQEYSVDVKRGLKAYQEKNYRKSAKIFQNLVNERAQDEDLSDRKKAIPYKFLGHSHFNLKNDRKARNAYRTALSLYPEFSELHLFLAQIAFRHNRYPETIKQCRAALNGGISKKKLFTLYGTALNRVGQYHQALDVFRNALLRAETDALSIRKKIAQLYLSTNQPDRALNILEPAIHQAPADTELLLLQARATISTGSLDRALNNLERARYLGENRPDLYRTLADLTFKKQQYRRALFLYKKYLSLTDEPEPQDLNRIVLAALKTGERSTAETYFFRALKSDQQFTGGPVQLAQQFKELGNRKKAVQLMKNLLEIAPGTDRALILLGNLELENENYKQALKYYKTVYENGNRTPRFQYNYIQTLIELNQTSRARTILQNAIANNPSNNDFHTLLNTWIEKQTRTR